MKPRVLLTGVWLVAFVCVLLILEGYIHAVSDDGLRLLLPADRWDLMRPAIILYGGYLGGILTFWFLRPFPAPQDDEAETVRYYIAGACTTLFNIFLIYMLAQHHLFGGQDDRTLIEQVESAVQFAGILSFLVGPINVYYFGMKSPA